MTAPVLAATLGADMLHFVSTIDELDNPGSVLDGLHKVVCQPCQIAVLGAALFPLRWADWSGVEEGKTVFLHKSVPAGWWTEYVNLGRRSPALGAALARVSLSSFTMSEMMRVLDPLGADRWTIELAHKYGMRDSLTCPVGGRWVFAYWSRNVLTRLSQEERAILFMGATFAAIRLQKLIGPLTDRIGQSAQLTPREIAVLRSLSVGKHMAEIATGLGLGEETVKSHLSKAQRKLGVRNRTHAVAQAMRNGIIP